MWKVLGRDAELVRIAELWKEGITALASDYEDFETFQELMAQAELTYLHNTQDDVHAFILQFPETVQKEELDFLSSFVRMVREEAGVSTITFQDKPQRCRLVFTSEKEPELLGLNKTEGYSSGALFQPIFDSWDKPRN
jgi:hypothetical protein